MASSSSESQSHLIASYDQTSLLHSSLYNHQALSVNIYTEAPSALPSHTYIFFSLLLRGLCCMCAKFVLFSALSCLSNGMSDKTHTEPEIFPSGAPHLKPWRYDGALFPVEFGTSSQSNQENLEAMRQLELEVFLEWMGGRGESMEHLGKPQTSMSTNGWRKKSWQPQILKDKIGRMELNGTKLKVMTRLNTKTHKNKKYIKVVHATSAQTEKLHTVSHFYG